MPPKFQSSFIPRGPAVSSMPASNVPVARRKQRSIFSFIANSIFTLSVLFAVGVFGYKYFLNYRIAQMGAELEAARASLDPQAVNELIRLNARLDSTKTLIEGHKIISPLFDYLESATPKTVRYNDFKFNTTIRGVELQLQGEASGYAALASAAEMFARDNSPFKSTAFSNLRLDPSGNVIFTVNTILDPNLISYTRFVEGLASSNQAASAESATTTPSAGTSTAPALPTGN